MIACAENQQKKAEKKDRWIRVKDTMSGGVFSMEQSVESKWSSTSKHTEYGRTRGL
jgi:hypothetical protein